MNNGKYYTERYQKLQAERRNAKFGPIKRHLKTCVRCSKEFTFEGREHTKAFRNANYCSRSCANSRQEHWDANATNYKTIAFKHWERKCVVCEETKILAVHHYNGNHRDDRPENLVPLCPTHHQYMHSRYKKDIEAIVETAMKSKWEGNGTAWGGRLACTEDIQ